jgi:hypothetical protein
MRKQKRKQIVCCIYKNKNRRLLPRKKKGLGKTRPDLCGLRTARVSTHTLSVLVIIAVTVREKIKTI